MKVKTILAMVYLGTTGILGFKRGTQGYNYDLEKMNQRYNKKDEYFYSICFAEGMVGSVIYMNPVTLLFKLPKEIYKLEVDLRNLEEEKKTDYYNKL